MGKMKHPPIPPNCDLFICVASGKVEGLAFDRPGCSCNQDDCCNPCNDELWQFHKVTPDQRRIIAAVARCAWLDEEVRIKDAFFKHQCEYHKKSFNQEAAGKLDRAETRSIKKLGECIDNAEAWKKWGEMGNG